ncbi:MAG: response regulator [Desulfobulbaceae bacterium]|nr:response regulator [Desulfobulbaceae bacterium]HIJ79821.1 response regulator [Deltaproteobacteria bacterium]
MQKTPVLYIDDEVINLINFKETFGDTYDVFVAGSGNEALEIIAENKEIAVVLSDQRMPGMSGTELLARVNEIAPNCERIMITAYTDPGDLIDAINRGHVYRYVVKPWDNDELRVALAHTVERFRLKQQNRALTDELQEKNERLVSLNNELEARVLARTEALDLANVKLKEKNIDLEQANLTINTQSEELRQANERLVCRVEELENAKKQVETLQNLLPICSYCKKIRDDNNYWQDLEAYFHHNTDMLFTHSICPTCYKDVVESQLKVMKKPR